VSSTALVGLTLAIGGATGGGAYLTGTVDDVRVYNRALSADEVYGLYRTSSPVCSSPSGYEGDVAYNNGTNHVMQFCDNASWRALGPVPGAGGGGCSSPAGNEKDVMYNKDYSVVQYCDGTHWIAMGHSPSLYVGDGNNSRVEKFDMNGNFLKAFGSAGSGNGQFGGIDSIAVDHDGNVWVGDDGLRIEKFDSEGNYLLQVATSNHPMGIAIDSGNNVWVTNWFANTVQEFDTNGKSIASFGTSGSADGQFGGQVVGIAADSSDNLWVADLSNNRMEEFNSSHSFLRKIVPAGTPDPSFAPYLAAMDINGDLLVYDAYNTAVFRFTGTGSYVSTLGGYGTGGGTFRSVGGIATNGSFIWVTDAADNLVEKFTSTGTYVSQFGAAGTGNGQFGTGPGAIAVGP
jgi:sugar lactone lactonase YvrE